MTEPPKQPPQEAELNPAMRQRREERYDTEHSTPPPVESASVQHQEGTGWPAAWLIVTIVCVLIGIYLIFF